MVSSSVVSEQREDQSEQPPEEPGSDAPAESVVEPTPASSKPPVSSSGGEVEPATESEREDRIATAQLQSARSLGAVPGPPRPDPPNRASSKPSPAQVSPDGDSLVGLVAEPVRDEATELDWGDEGDEPETATADRRMVDMARARSAQLGRDDASQTLDLDALGSAAAEADGGIDDPSTFDTSAAFRGDAAGIPAPPRPQAPSPHAYTPTGSGVQSLSAPAASVGHPLGAAPPAPRGATTHQLHTEDEDGPTMVAYAHSAPDEEATQLHNAPAPRAPALQPPGLMTPPPHGALGDPRPFPPPSERTANLPHPLAAAPLPLAAAPLAPPVPTAPMAGVQAALREAAVQAALAAATSNEDSPEAQAQRVERLETLITVLLGVGLVVGALGGYLSAAAVADGEGARGAAYAGTSLVASFALFGCGLAALQRRVQTKVALVIVSAALLVFALARVLVIAAT